MGAAAADARLPAGRQADSAEDAPDDISHPPSGECHPDDGAGDDGAQRRAALVGERQLGDRPLGRYAAGAEERRRPPGTVHGDVATGDIDQFQHGLYHRVRLGRSAVAGGGYHVWCHDVVPAISQPDTATHPADGEHAAADDSRLGQHRPVGGTGAGGGGGRQ